VVSFIFGLECFSECLSFVGFWLGQDRALISAGPHQTLEATPQTPSKSVEDWAPKAQGFWKIVADDSEWRLRSSALRVKTHTTSHKKHNSLKTKSSTASIQNHHKPLWKSSVIPIEHLCKIKFEKLHQKLQKL